jgi:hypothetical protein
MTIDMSVLVGSPYSAVTIDVRVPVDFLPGAGYDADVPAEMRMRYSVSGRL